MVNIKCLMKDCSEHLGDALTQAFEQYGPMMVFLRNLQDVKRVLPVLFQPRSKANQQLRRECCVLFPNKHSRLEIKLTINN